MKEQYEWVDLRKDPDNLPTDTNIYFVCTEEVNGRKFYTTRRFNPKYKVFGELVRVIGWKRIEEMEE